MENKCKLQPREEFDEEKWLKEVMMLTAEKDFLPVSSEKEQKPGSHLLLLQSTVTTEGTRPWIPHM